MNKRLHIAIDFGEDNIILRLNQEGKLALRSFLGDRETLIRCASYDYQGENLEECISKIDQCIEGTDDPKEIRYYATHPKWEVKYEVARQGFELDRLLLDVDGRVRYMAKKSYARSVGQGSNRNFILPEKYRYHGNSQFPP